MKGSLVQIITVSVKWIAFCFFIFRNKRHFYVSRKAKIELSSWGWWKTSSSQGLIRAFSWCCLLFLCVCVTGMLQRQPTIEDFVDALVSELNPNFETFIMDSESWATETDFTRQREWTRGCEWTHHRRGSDLCLWNSRQHFFFFAFMAHNPSGHIDLFNMCAPFSCQHKLLCETKICHQLWGFFCVLF